VQDINNDATFSILTGYNDWNNVLYNFQSTSNFEDGKHTTTADLKEIDKLTARKLDAPADPLATRLAVNDVLPSDFPGIDAPVDDGLNLKCYVTNNTEYAIRNLSISILHHKRCKFRKIAVSETKACTVSTRVLRRGVRGYSCRSYGIEETGKRIRGRGAAYVNGQ